MSANHQEPRIGTGFQRYLYANYRGFFSLKRAFYRRFTRAGFLVLAGLIATGSLGLDTNLAVTYQAFAFLAALMLVALVASRFRTPTLEIHRELPRYTAAGVRFHYTIRVKNLGERVEAGLSLVEEPTDPRPSLREFCSIAEPGEEERNWLDRRYLYYRWMWVIGINQRAFPAAQAIPKIAAQSEIEFTAELTPLRRGVLRLEGATVHCPDPFGLLHALVRLPAPQKVLVLPKRYAVRNAALPGSLKYQQGGVALASSVGESEEFIALRDYRPGDPWRRIHWKSWAKTGRPIVKEFQDENFVRHALVLDTFSDEPFSELFEEAVSVAASFAWTIQTQDSLLDLVFVGTEAYCFTAGRGVAHTEQILEILSAVRICADEGFETLSRAVFDRISGVSGCIVVLLAWDERRQAFVKRLRQYGVPVRVFVMLRADAKPLDAGPMKDEPENLIALPLGSVGEKLALA